MHLTTIPASSLGGQPPEVLGTAGFPMAPHTSRPKDFWGQKPQVLWRRKKVCPTGKYSFANAQSSSFRCGRFPTAKADLIRGIIFFTYCSLWGSLPVSWDALFHSKVLRLHKESCWLKLKPTGQFPYKTQFCQYPVHDFFSSEW